MKVDVSHALKRTPLFTNYVLHAAYVRLIVVVADAHHQPRAPMQRGCQAGVYVGIKLGGVIGDSALCRLRSDGGCAASIGGTLRVHMSASLLTLGATCECIMKQRVHSCGGDVGASTQVKLH